MQLLELIDAWIAVYENEQARGFDHRRVLATLHEIRGAARVEDARQLSLFV